MAQMHINRDRLPELEFNVQIVNSKGKKLNDYNFFEDEDSGVYMWPVLNIDSKQLANAIAFDEHRMAFIKDFMKSFDNEDIDGYDDLIALTVMALKSLSRQIDTPAMKAMCSGMAKALDELDY